MKRLGYALALFSLGCGDEAGGAFVDDEQDSIGGSCGPENETRRCMCDAELAGRQVCEASGWGDCTCESDDGSIVVRPVDGASSGTPAGNARSDIVFDWERTEAQEGSCEPGRYTGDFMGLYASQLTFINFPIPVFALGTLDRPGLAFTLEKQGEGERLEIRNGVMEGTADGFFPFRGTLTGSLDCKTGVFEAELSGFYSLGVEGIGMFKFKGPLKGNYDRARRAIQEGSWKVDEYDPPPTLPNAGGQGIWHATWVGP